MKPTQQIKLPDQPLQDSSFVEAHAPLIPARQLELLRQDIQREAKPNSETIPQERHSPETEDKYFKERLGEDPPVSIPGQNPSDKYHNLDLGGEREDVMPPTERPYFPREF